MALFILSPLAGVMAERLSMRRLLNITTACRGLIYVLLMPLTWVCKPHTPYIIGLFYVL